MCVCWWKGSVDVRVFQVSLPWLLGNRYSEVLWECQCMFWHLSSIPAFLLSYFFLISSFCLVINNHTVLCRPGHEQLLRWQPFYDEKHPWWILQIPTSYKRWRIKLKHLSNGPFSSHMPLHPTCFQWEIPWDQTYDQLHVRQVFCIQINHSWLEEESKWTYYLFN